MKATKQPTPMRVIVKGIKQPKPTPMRVIVVEAKPAPPAPRFVVHGTRGGEVSKADMRRAMKAIKIAKKARP